MHAHSPIYSKHHRKLILTYLNMPSISIMDGEAVATLHVLLTAPNSEHGQVSVQQTKGTRTPCRALWSNQLLSKMHLTSSKQTTAAVNASKGVNSALGWVKQLDQESAMSVTSTDAIGLGASGSAVILTSGKTWADTLTSKMKTHKEQLLAAMQECASHARMGTDSRCMAVADITSSVELEDMQSPDRRVRTIFYESTEEALYLQAGDNDFPSADHFHWTRE